MNDVELENRLHELFGDRARKAPPPAADLLDSVKRGSRRRGQRRLVVSGLASVAAVAGVAAAVAL
ncbi:MAG TPA: hypothetical protein VE172_11970, partial [Stackebrandtia sp.]